VEAVKQEAERHVGVMAVNDEMKVAAARALGACVARGELSAEDIIPSVFNKTVAPAVAEGVARAAWQTGAARRRRRFDVSVGQ
jgi:malate dehydrogenase (oxaloacetate-decarboxylating)